MKLKLNNLTFKPAKSDENPGLATYWYQQAKKAREYAIAAHKDVNQWYDDVCKYEYHLTMTVHFASKFSHLFTEVEFWKLVTVLWLHDTVEDARKTYNDIKNEFGIEVAEAVRCCTNDNRGRTRAERMPDWLYREISENFIATAAKAFDRIANMSHSKFWDSSMYPKYVSELSHFIDMLNVFPDLRAIFAYLVTI